MASQYSSIPHQDAEVDISPHAHLLPTSESDDHVVRVRMPSAYSVTLSPVLCLRVLSFILSLVAFIIFVIDGGDAFIASDIFLAFLMIFNVLMVVQYSVQNVFKVTVEIRQAAWKHDVGSSMGKPKKATYVDVGLSACLTICLLLGNALQNRYYGGAYKAAVVLGYFVVLFQVLLAVPALDAKSLTLTARLTDLNPKHARDSKVPVEASTATGGLEFASARRRNAESEEPRLTGENLV